MMKPRCLVLIVCLALLPAPPAGRCSDRLAPGDFSSSSVRFEAVNVYIDAGASPLAAYQFELTARGGNALLVGLEGGGAAPFKTPPFYDPAALIDRKIIVAAFSLAPVLPRGRSRVARLMVQVSGPADPHYLATLTVAASSDGAPIAAAVSVTVEGAGSASASAVGDEIVRAGAPGVSRGADR